MKDGGKMIDGIMLKNAIIGGAREIAKHCESVDAINVFPVPDGDTGTNLCLTLGGCVQELEGFSNKSAGKTADFVAGELLKCARGNSGVIFSLIFGGFAKSVEGLDEIDALSLAKGLEKGCEEAYAAIDKPTEGTMLTVIRMAASKALCAAEKGADLRQTFDAAMAGAKAALKSTANLLPILKKRGIVDAGAQGLVHIMEGMVNTSQTEEAKAHKPLQKQQADFSSGNIYCTEFIITKSNDRNVAEIRRFLGEIGDCPAAAEHSGIIKIHVHTHSPHLALQKGLEYGELSKIKIDNMRLQSTASGR